MKQPKRLTRTQKKIVSGHKLNPENWMLVLEENGAIEVINKKSGKIRSLERRTR